MNTIHDTPRAPLRAERRRRPVSRQEPDVVAQREQAAADGVDQRRVIAAGEVRPADRALEQHVPDLRRAMELAAGWSGYPIWAPDIDSGKAAVTAQLEGTLKAHMDAARARREQMHAVLDSQESYRATQSACRHW